MARRGSDQINTDVSEFGSGLMSKSLEDATEMVVLNLKLLLYDPQASDIRLSIFCFC